jgi:Flp pilus assembly protein TadG
MAAAKAQRERRRAAAAVETALVVLPVLLFFYGIFEYGRFVMDRNILDNAAREGCRWALVNNQDTSISADVQNVVLGYMAGRNSAAFSNFTISVSGTHNGVATPVNNLMPGDLITVTVSGQYQFLNLPMLNMPSLTMTSSCTMGVEGAT